MTLNLYINRIIAPNQYVHGEHERGGIQTDKFYHSLSRMHSMLTANGHFIVKPLSLDFIF